jgi:hypothetical protein
MRYIKEHYFLLLFVLSLIVSINGEASGKTPSLYGNVRLSTPPQGYVPLGDAVVELLSPDSDKIIYKTYTDSRGNYAFYEVSPGEYDVRIVFGRKVMQQLTGQMNKIREKLRVKISGQKAVKIPEITVK